MDLMDIHNLLSCSTLVAWPSRTSPTSSTYIAHNRTYGSRQPARGYVGHACTAVRGLARCVGQISPCDRATDRHCGHGRARALPAGRPHASHVK
jgi:hypothetical protein